MSTFSDDEVRRLLEARFVPVALDCIYWERRDDEDGKIFQALAAVHLNEENPDGSRSTQGHYAFTHDGRLLAAHNRRGKEAALALLAEALGRFEALERAPGEGGGVEPAAPAAPAEPRGAAPGSRPDRRYVRALPEGGLALDVHTRILSWDASRQDGLTDFHRGMMEWNRSRAGFDHLWVTPSELAELTPPADAAPGDRRAAPRSLARRLARFHLTDNVRGEPPHFRAHEVRRSELSVEVVAVEGSLVRLAATGHFEMAQAGEHPCGFRGGLEGTLCYDRAAGRFTRFDLYAEGEFVGEGRWTPGAPRGPFRLAVACELPRTGFAAGVPPQGMRDERGYLDP